MSSHSSPLIIIFHTYNWNNTKVVEREVRKNIKKKSTPPPTRIQYHQRQTLYLLYY